MKTFRIPLVDKVLYIYVGKEEWESFKKGSIGGGADESLSEPYPGKDSGRAGGSWIWIDNIKDRNLIIHELTHFIDHLLIYLHSNDEEFRAYLTAWVIDTVLKWVEKR